MQKYRKILIISAAIFLLAAGCNRAANQSVSESANQQVSQPTPTPTSTEVVPKGMTQTKDNAGQPDYTPGFVVVTDSVEGSNLNHVYDKVKEGTTAYDLLSSTHTVDFKDYGSSLGKMVTGIDGNKADSKHFWEFFVNGKSSNVGASSYTLKDGDKIEWKLTALSSSAQ